MLIQLSKLVLLNFKGAKSLEVEFTNVTDIYGDNGTYKSTLFDAFTWLLFGKDSHDSKDFNVKTLDSSGAAIPMLEHSVEGVLDVDGAEMTFKRLFQEKWTRRRGSEKSELTGHETLYYLNGVPLQAGEYKAKVDALVSEGLFKLLTSALYFNSLKWTDRRRALTMIAGDITTADILGTMSKAHAEIIKAILNSGKDLAEFRKEVAMRKKKLQDDLNAIPVRVDEVSRNLPPEQGWDALELEAKQLEQLIADIDATINDEVAVYKSKSEDTLEIQNSIFTLRQIRQEFENKIINDVNHANNDRLTRINSARQSLDAAKNLYQGSYLNYDSAKRRIDRLDADLIMLREDWQRIASEVATFEVDPICPTCKRELDQDIIITDLQLHFKANQTKRLDAINAEGVRLKGKLAEEYQALAILEQTMSEQQLVAEKAELLLKEAEAEKVVELAAFGLYPKHHELTDKILALELKISEAPKIDTAGLQAKKAEAQTQLDAMRLQIATRETIAKGQQRIKELMAEEKDLAQQISDLEKKEFAMEAYTRANMNMVEERVNSKFTIVQFRLFNTLLNGGTEEACDCLVNGVPIADVNSAGKIQAGIDIINTLSDHYGIYCPIWVDNRESTNVLPPTKSQVINLIVSHDKSLKIQTYGK